MLYPPLLLLLLPSAFPLAQATQWYLSDTYIGNSFFSGFSHQAISDPTHGRVQYVNEATARQYNLSWANGSKFRIRSDFQKTLTPSGPGRMSVRLKSNKQWSSSALVLDVTHIPRGCGTWPAFWTVGNSWPSGGEIDIIEGVNDVTPNQATLHTSSGCTQPGKGKSWKAYSGNLVSTNCDSSANHNSGCGIQAPTSNSFGPPFDSNGGGWYAMERTGTTISVWFWPRNSKTVPSDVRNGQSTIRTLEWGTPFAAFVGDSCSIPSHFGPHNIIINLTFCGDWAGSSSAYSGAGCPGTCVDYVNKNPSAFVNAYFEFNSLRIYTASGYRSFWHQMVEDGWLSTARGALSNVMGWI